LATRPRYTEAFREQALEKAYSRGRRTVPEVAAELNISVWTLKNWMKSSNQRLTSNRQGQSPQRPQDWTREQRLEVLMQSHGLDEQALNALCREKGLFRHHLQQWRQEFVGRRDGDAQELRALKQREHALERELRRKDKALAEAAALLVLQKKVRALWGDEDE